jgi:hypothetical protein
LQIPFSSRALSSRYIDDGVGAFWRKAAPSKKAFAQISTRPAPDASRQTCRRLIKGGPNPHLISSRTRHPRAPLTHSLSIYIAASVITHYIHECRELLHASAPMACRWSFNKKYAAENALCEVGMRNCLRRLHAKCRQQQQQRTSSMTHTADNNVNGRNVLSAGGEEYSMESKETCSLFLLCFIFECRLAGLRHELRKYAARNVIHQHGANMCRLCADFD